MNPAFLSLMSGPLAALLRYGISAGATAALATHAIPDNIVAQGAAFLTACVPAIIGAITSTKSAAVAKVAELPGYGVKTPSGAVVTSAAEANAVAK